MPEARWSYYITRPWELVDEWYRAVKFGIRNLIQWFPVVWVDRHYTSWGLFNVIRHKLVLMQLELRRNPYYVGAERDLHLMHVCEQLIERYFAGEYSDSCDKRHEEKWGEWRHYEPFGPDEDGLYQVRRSGWPNAPTTELEQKAWKEMMACSKHAHMLKQQDVRYLFKLLSKHSERW